MISKEKVLFMRMLMFIMSLFIVTLLINQGKAHASTSLDIQTSVSQVKGGETVTITTNLSNETVSKAQIIYYDSQNDYVYVTLEKSLESGTYVGQLTIPKHGKEFLGNWNVRSVDFTENGVSETIYNSSVSAGSPSQDLSSGTFVVTEVTPVQVNLSSTEVVGGDTLNITTNIAIDNIEESYLEFKKPDGNIERIYLTKNVNTGTYEGSLRIRNYENGIVGNWSLAKVNIDHALYGDSYIYNKDIYPSKETGQDFSSADFLVKSITPLEVNLSQLEVVGGETIKITTNIAIDVVEESYLEFKKPDGNIERIYLTKNVNTDMYEGSLRIRNYENGMIGDWKLAKVNIDDEWYGDKFIFNQDLYINQTRSQDLSSADFAVKSTTPLEVNVSQLEVVGGEIIKITTNIAIDVVEESYLEFEKPDGDIERIYLKRNVNTDTYEGSLRIRNYENGMVGDWKLAKVNIDDEWYGDKYIFNQDLYTNQTRSQDLSSADFVVKSTTPLEVNVSQSEVVGGETIKITTNIAIDVVEESYLEFKKPDGNVERIYLTKNVNTNMYEGSLRILNYESGMVGDWKLAKVNIDDEWYGDKYLYNKDIYTDSNQAQDMSSANFIVKEVTDLKLITSSSQVMGGSHVKVITNLPYDVIEDARIYYKQPDGSIKYYYLYKNYDTGFYEGKIEIENYEKNKGIWQVSRILYDDKKYGDRTIYNYHVDDRSGAQNLSAANFEVISNDAYATMVNGFVSLYLGNSGSAINDKVVQNLDTLVVSDLLKELTFTLITENKETVEYLGLDVFVADTENNLFTIQDNKVLAQLNMPLMSSNYTTLVISGPGYLAHVQNLNLDSVTTSLDITLYPGDIGKVTPDQGLVLSQDQKLDHIDFSAWYKIYQSVLNETATSEDVKKADLSLNGVVDLDDYNLWLESYKNLPLTM